MITMRALCITAEKRYHIVLLTGARLANSPTSHKSFRFSIAKSQIVAIYGIFPNAHEMRMKCLSIHEHILGDKIAKFEARALATYSV